MSSRIDRLLARSLGGAFVGEAGAAGTRRFESAGAASRWVHDTVWNGSVGTRGTVSRRRGEELARFTKVADRAVEVRNLTVGTVQYEYNPTPVRPYERHWSPAWPPTGILYHETAEPRELG